MAKHCTTIYFVFLILIFPLYFQNNYIDILEAKTSLFVIVTVIYLLFMPCCIGIDYVPEDKKKKGKQQSGKKGKTHKISSRLQGNSKISLQTGFFLCFVCILIFTTLASGDIANAWVAPNTKLFGTKILLLCCGIYMAIPKEYTPGRVVKGSMLVGTGIVFLLTILNRFQIDPLQMYRNLIPDQHSIYLSTIGNANILSNYICVFLPIIMALYLFNKNMLSKYIYGVMLGLGLMAGISTNSDSFLLGYGAAMLILLWCAFVSSERLQAYVEICCFSTVAMIILSVCNLFTSPHIAWEPVQQFLIEDIPWMNVIAVLLVVLVIVKRYRLESLYCKGRLVLFAGLGIAAAGFLVYVVTINVAGSETANQYLIMSEEWGTNRGFAWMNTVTLFAELPWFQQFFGIGPGSFHEFFAIPNQSRIKPFVDPHSDYLFYLVTTGFLGFISWLGMILSSIFFCLKKGSKDAVIYSVALVAWVAQAAVNTSLVFTAPYLFAILGMCKQKKNQKGTFFGNSMEKIREI